MSEKKDICQAALVFPSTMSLGQIVKEAGMHPGMTETEILMDHLIYGEDEEEYEATDNLDFCTRQVVETVRTFRVGFRDAAEALEIPLILWHPTTDAAAVPDYFDIVIATDTANDPAVQFELWKRAERNPHASFLLSQWEEPDRILRALLDSINREKERAFHLLLTTAANESDETAAICQKALLASYISRQMN